MSHHPMSLDRQRFLEGRKCAMIGDISDQLVLLGASASVETEIIYGRGSRTTSALLALCRRK